MLSRATFRRFVPTGVATALTLSLAGVGVGVGVTPAAAAGAGSASSAARVLDSLTVKGRAPMTGYTRDQFGQAWADVNRNGCDTRNDILKSQGTKVTFKAGTRGCVVATVTINDPYSGQAIAMKRADGKIQIDHAVALANSWVMGAQKWSPGKRVAFANDPMNLLAVNSRDNMKKQASDAASWLPPAKSYRCSYVARQIAVKKKYSLAVTKAEKAAMVTVLSKCPTQKLPKDSGQKVTTTVGIIRTTPAKTTAKPKPVTNVVYANCTAARAAGVTPLYRGKPGYSTKLDRDGDGVACE